MSIRAIYSVFENKDGLIDALAIRAFGRLRQRIDRIATSEDPVGDLVAAGREFFRLAVESPETYRLAWERVFTTDLDANPTWAEEALHARSALRVRIDRAFGDRGHSGTNPRQLTAAFHAICQGFASCHVNQVFEGMRVREAEQLLVATLKHWVDAELRLSLRSRTGAAEPESQA